MNVPGYEPTTTHERVQRRAKEVLLGETYSIAEMSADLETLTDQLSKVVAEVVDLRTVFNKPLRETILAVLMTMPKDASTEHLAAMIEGQVQAWQAIPVRDDE